MAYGGGGGPDLTEAAERAGLSVDDAVALHAGAVYDVYMLGFLPGFAYLGDLPDALRLPRRATPRARVPAGSVAIAAEMTAIYPLESPGGWHLIGSTPVRPWDMSLRREPLFRPGDRVRFQPVSLAEAQELARLAARRLDAAMHGGGVTGFLRIVDPGVAATLQDCGRLGFQRFGVPVSGALDPVSLHIANVLVGNPPGEAALELLGAGLALKVEADRAVLALAGIAGPFVLETAQAIRAHPAVSKRHRKARRYPAVSSSHGGAVSYLAAAGGFDLPAVFRQRIDLPARRAWRLSRAAAAGGRSSPSPPRCCAGLAYCFRSIVMLSAPQVLRVLRGPNAEYFQPGAFETLFSSSYTVAPASDRMGLRLQGPPLARAIDGELPPQGTTAGGMQVPADGQPILLLADRQTTGGYPRIATVIGADIAAAGRLAAGMSVRFAEVSREEAVAALKAQRDWLASLPSLLKPVADAFCAERLYSENLIGGVTSGGAEEE